MALQLYECISSKCRLSMTSKHISKLICIVLFLLLVHCVIRENWISRVVFRPHYLQSMWVFITCYRLSSSKEVVLQCECIDSANNTVICIIFFYHIFCPKLEVTQKIAPTNLKYKSINIHKQIKRRRNKKNSPPNWISRRSTDDVGSGGIAYW